MDRSLQCLCCVSVSADDDVVPHVAEAITFQRQNMATCMSEVNRVVQAETKQAYKIRYAGIANYNRLTCLVSLCLTCMFNNTQQLYATAELRL